MTRRCGSARDVNGGIWVYPMRKPLTYIRGRVTVESLEGELAIL